MSVGARAGGLSRPRQRPPAPIPRLRVDLISHRGSSVMHAAGCTLGARGGMSVGCARRGLVASAPAPTGYRFWRPCRGFGMRALGRRWRAGRQGRSADVLGRSRRAPQSRAPTSAGNKLDQAPTGAHQTVAGGRWRGRDKPPARAPHVPPGARVPRTSRPRRAHPTYIPLPARAPHVHPSPRVRRASGRSRVVLTRGSTLRP
jgi:hypothetical protein